MSKQPQDQLQKWIQVNTSVQCPVCGAPCLIELHYLFKMPRRLRCPKCKWAPQEDLPTIEGLKKRRKQYEEHR